MRLGRYLRDTLYKSCIAMKNSWIPFFFEISLFLWIILCPKSTILLAFKLVTLRDSINKNQMNSYLVILGAKQ